MRINIKPIVNTNDCAEETSPSAGNQAVRSKCLAAAIAIIIILAYGMPVFSSESNPYNMPAVKRIGMFSAFQAINDKTGIRDILDSVYGTDQTCSIMDYAMYSIVHHTDDASAFS